MFPVTGVRWFGNWPGLDNIDGGAFSFCFTKSFFLSLAWFYHVISLAVNNYLQVVTTSIAFGTTVVLRGFFLTPPFFIFLKSVMSSF